MGRKPSSWCVNKIIKENFGKLIGFSTEKC